MGRQQGWIALLLALAIAATVACLNFPIGLGLDLRGGTQLTLEVQPTDEKPILTSDDIEAVKVVLNGRVNGLGVAESNIQTIGKDQLIVELPGDPGEEAALEAEELVKARAVLEFRAQKVGTELEMQSLRQLSSQITSIIEYNNSIANKGEDLSNLIDIDQLNSLKQKLGLTSLSGPIQSQLQQISDDVNKKIVALYEPANLKGNELVSAGRQQQLNSSAWEVTLTFNQEGGEKFADLTKKLAGTGRFLGIILDDVPISAATVGNQFKVAGITGGSATISGNFDAQAAKLLQIKLNGGALPNPIKLIQTSRISPNLGAENIRNSLIAALGGLVAVAIFMVTIYRLPGIVSVFSLMLYALFNLAIYGLIEVILTLPGIAGFILSVGMAVDANVLIFERVKDELRRGNTLIRSIESGFSQAFSSILDGHITTLISCIALFTFGTGFVKGFAATLGIGVTVSLFTALACTRTILRFLMGYQGLRKQSNFLPINQIPSKPIEL